jgi:hypothetical protein
LKDKKNLNGLSITNRICFESLRDQVNTIKVKTGNEQTVLQFTRDEPTAVLETSREQKPK